MSRYSPAAEAAKAMLDPIWLMLTFGIIHLICSLFLDDVEKGAVKVCVGVVVGVIEFVLFYRHFHKNWRKYDPMFKYMLPSYSRN